MSSLTARSAVRVYIEVSKSVALPPNRDTAIPPRDECCRAANVTACEGAPPVASPRQDSGAARWCLVVAATAEVRTNRTEHWFRKHASALMKTDADGGIGSGKRSANHKINRRRGDAGDREKQRPANRRQPNDPPPPREQAHERHRRNHQPKKYGSLSQKSRKATRATAWSTRPATRQYSEAPSAGTDDAQPRAEEHARQPCSKVRADDEEREPRLPPAPEVDVAIRTMWGFVGRCRREVDDE